MLDGIADFGGSEMQVSLATMRSIYGIAGDAQLAVRARSDSAARPLERRIEALMARDYPGLELASIADKKQEVRDQVSATVQLDRGDRRDREPARGGQHAGDVRCLSARVRSAC